MGKTDCTETSVVKYQPMLYKNPERQRPQLPNTLLPRTNLESIFVLIKSIGRSLKSIIKNE
jgi:hypothetical protein